MARVVATLIGLLWCHETAFNRLCGVGFFLGRKFFSLPKVLFDFMWPRINLGAVGETHLR